MFSTQYSCIYLEVNTREPAQDLQYCQNIHFRCKEFQVSFLEHITIGGAPACTIEVELQRRGKHNYMSNFKESQLCKLAFAITLKINTMHHYTHLMHKTICPIMRGRSIMLPIAYFYGILPCHNLIKVYRQNILDQNISKPIHAKGYYLYCNWKNLI